MGSERCEFESRERVSLCQWLYGGMTYEGNKVFTNAQIDDLLRLKPGMVFNKQRIEAQYQSITLTNPSFCVNYQQY